MASIKVTSPNSSDTIKRGQYIRVQWEVIDPGGFTATTVNINLRQSDGGGSLTVGELVPLNQGFYIYKIPENISIENHFIRIKDLTSATDYDGDDFPIQEKYSVADFNYLNSFEKMILVEGKLGKEISTNDYYSDATFLLHSRNANGSTSFVDSSIEAPSTITGNGGITHSTTESVFDGSSIKFIDTSSQFLSMAANAKFDLPNKLEFTIRCKVNFSSLGSGDYIFCEYVDANNRWSIRKSSVDQLLFNIRIGGVNVAQIISTPTVSTSTWYDVLVARDSSGNLGLYVDGIQKAYLSYSTLHDLSAGTSRIGSSEGTANMVNGYIDELVIWDKNKFNLTPNAGHTSVVPVNTKPYATYVEYLGNEEIIDLKENETYLTRVFSKEENYANAGTFYNDYENERLYINPTDVDPYYLAYVFKCFTNRQDTDYPIDFIPQNARYNHFYAPYLKSDSVPQISQKVGDYYTSALTIQFGSIMFVNDGWFWEARELYEWHNKEFTVKVGEKDSLYNEFVTVFNGISKNPDISDEIVSISLKDARAGYLKPLPATIYTLTANPDLETSDINKPMPIVFGIKNNVTLTRVDGKTFRIGTNFRAPDGTWLGYNSVDAVYVDGIEQYLTTDYTVNAANVKITFVNDPLDALVTADIQGANCEVDFSDGSFTGNFSENVADILYTMLVSLTMNSMPVDKIDLDSFYDLQSKRTQRLGFVIDVLQPTMEIIRGLQRSTVFHFIPTLDGRFQVKYNDRTETDLPEFRNENYNGFKIREVTDSAFKKVIIQYDRDPSLDEWKQVESEELETKYRHDKDDVLTVPTYLVNEAEAEALNSFYLDLVKDPSGKLETEISAEGLNYIPSGKAKFNRSIIKGDGAEVVILEDEIYTILELRKDINTGKVGVTAIKDSQATGEGTHADIAHADSHLDSHVDSHTDTAHTDSHSDTAYVDAHGDTAHIDSYSDETYNDHDDTHEDQHFDSHMDYSDGEYIDTPHVDEHTDIHDDHTDNSHSHTDSHSDTAHIDWHDDVAYIDTHGDGYTDSYSDTHSDVHEDIPHTDSDI